MTDRAVYDGMTFRADEFMPIAPGWVAWVLWADGHESTVPVVGWLKVLYDQGEHVTWVPATWDNDAFLVPLAQCEPDETMRRRRGSDWWGGKGGIDVVLVKTQEQSDKEAEGVR